MFQNLPHVNIWRDRVQNMTYFATKIKTDVEIYEFWPFSMRTYLVNSQLLVFIYVWIEVIYRLINQVLKGGSFVDMLLSNSYGSRYLLVIHLLHRQVKELTNDYNVSVRL